MFRPSLALVSTSVPPAPSGQANVIANLTKSMTPERCVFVTDDPSPHLIRPQFADLKRIPPPPFEISEVDAGRKSKEVFIEIKKRAASLIKLFSKDRPDVLVACSGNLFDIPASAIACNAMNVPLIVYLFDDCVMQWRPGNTRRIAKFLERFWSKSAAKVIVPNESLAEQIQFRTGKSPEIIRNPADDIFFEENIQQFDRRSDIQKIVYTGSVYWAQADAINNLLNCIDKLDGKYELHLYTAQDQSVLTSLGLTSKYLVHHGYAEPRTMANLQRGADILFLPLSFDENMRHLVVSSSPQKMGEYLTSGRPVLIHAPANAFVCKFYGERECGTIVAENSIDSLREGLQLITYDSRRARTLCENAKNAAQEFRSDLIETSFLNLITSVSFDAIYQRLPSIA